MSSDWYTRKLGGQQRQPVAPSLPPTGPRFTPQAPQVYQSPHPQPAPYGQPQAPAQQPTQMRKPTQAEWQAMSAEQQSAFVRGTMLEHPEWLDKAKQAGEVYRCPSCGSNNFFARTKMGGSMGKPPAPRCFDCGYNGMYDQFGNQN